MKDMKNIYSFLSVLALIAACHAASAQDLDPTVIVDRAYEGKLMEVHKPSLEMSVPDTLMRFDLDFDYSVFDRPYKGSYEFNPYLLSMKPSVASDRLGKLYLRAGAGYQLRPEVDFIWSPDLGREALRLDVYADHRSYFGNVAVLDDADRTFRSLPGSGFMKTDAGVNIGYDWGRSTMDMKAGYYGNHRLESGEAARNYNAVDAAFSIGSRDRHAVEGLVYGIDASYRFASDRGLNENGLDMEAMFAMSSKKTGRRMLVEVDFGHDAYSGVRNGSASVISVSPHYVWDKGRLHVDLGLKFSKVICDTTSRLFVFKAKEQIVYPDVKVRFPIVRDALMFYASAGGGNKVNSYSDLVERGFFLDVIEGGSDVLGLYYGTDMGICVDRVTAKAGFEGRAGSSFSWNLYAGYADHASAVLDSANPLAGVTGVDYAPYRSWNVTFEGLWRSERFMADANITYLDAWGDAFMSLTDNFKPAAFTGDVSFQYNYNRRIFAGIDCSFSSERVCRGRTFVIPGYADLGLSAEYVTSGAMSFWLRGGNLLGMPVFSRSIFALKGPYFTLGISLNL